MSETASTPPALPDSAPLVAQWHDILEDASNSGLSAGVLHNELQTLADWMAEGLTDLSLTDERAYERMAAAGEQLVDLGINQQETLARAQGVLVSWLSTITNGKSLNHLITAFSSGSYQALQKRFEQSKDRQQEELQHELESWSTYSALTRRFERDLSAVGEDEKQLISTALTILQRELDAEGIGFFEFKEGRWSLQQAQGIVPSISFIQPPDGQQPPLFEDGQPQEELLKGRHQVAVPVPIDPSRRGLLFLLLTGTDRVSSALLESLGTIGQALGRALDKVSLEQIIELQLNELRALEVASKREKWGSDALRRLAMLIDEEDEIKPLDSIPTTSETVEPQQALVPLTIRDQTLGRLLLEDEDRDEWSEEELGLINIVAEQMAQSLELARLFRESQRRAVQLEAAAEVSRAASSLLSVDELMDTAVEQIRRTFGYYHVQVFLLDENKRWAVLRSSTGEIGKRLLARNHKLAVGSRSLIGQVTKSAQAIVARDTEVDQIHWFNELLPETRAEAAVPLKVGSTVIGALDVQSRTSNVFYEEDMAILQILADQMSVAIQNASAFERQRDTAEQLREMDKLKTQFLANMSHELRTPLNSIIGFSRVILKGIDGPVTDLQKKDLTTIYNSGQLLLQLIDSILDISKIEAGKMELEFEELQPQQVIEVAMSTAVGLLKDKPVELIKEVDDELPAIKADSMRLRQVFLNLLSNAAKFTEEGHIRIAAAQTGNEILFTVSDTGLGIPPEKQEKLFEAFYQVDGSATRKVGGTGLGLAITRSFVELHGGQIWVESPGVPGQGTTFHFTIPIQGPPEKEEEAPQSPLILAIDDEPGITLLYEKYLVPEGFRFESCHDPYAAVETAINLQPNLILLDLRMPDFDGYKVLDGLRNSLLTSDIPIVICSIESIENIENEALEAGASDFLQKPVLRQDLVAVAKRWTGKPTTAGVESE